MNAEILETFDNYCRGLLSVNADIVDEQNYLRFVRDVFRIMRGKIDEYATNFPDSKHLSGELTQVAWRHLECFRENYLRRSMDSN